MGCGMILTLYSGRKPAIRACCTQWCRVTPGPSCTLPQVWCYPVPNWHPLEPSPHRRSLSLTSGRHIVHVLCLRPAKVLTGSSEGPKTGCPQASYLKRRRKYVCEAKSGPVLDSPRHCDQTHLTALTISYLKGVSMRSTLDTPLKLQDSSSPKS